MFESALLAAMLADICESIYGSNAKGAPKILAYCHCGWACGPILKDKTQTFLEFQQSRRESPDVKPEEIEEWKKFLETCRNAR